MTDGTLVNIGICRGGVAANMLERFVKYGKKSGRYSRCLNVENNATD